MASRSNREHVSFHAASAIVAARVAMRGSATLQTIRTGAPVRAGAYEKRAAKTLVPITKAMEEGKEYMRSFSDLLQFHRKKQEPTAEAPALPPEVATPAEENSA